MLSPCAADYRQLPAYTEYSTPLRTAPCHTSPRPTEKAVALNLILTAAKKSRTVSRDDVRFLRKVVGKIQTEKDLQAKIERLVTG